MACLPTFTAAASTDTKNTLEETLIIGSKEQAKQQSGSAHVVDEGELAIFSHNDITQVLNAVPGVYFRQEDGFGLRPNIGIRGVTTERSQKITVMEDGILITPSPYSAPAAYYIPNVNRMTGVEVSKGPASIAYGPHTVGGAINLVSRPVTSQSGELSASYGNFNQQKYQGYYTQMGENLGFLVEGLRYSSDGFKTLKNGANTGFIRQDINAKVLLKSSDDAAMPQKLVIKLGYADEKSNETYVGLSRADFSADPSQRYAATARDKFESTHLQLHGIHALDISESLMLTTKAYWQTFDRTWFRLQGLGQGGATLAQVLASPKVYSRYMDIIEGTQDTNPSDDKETLVFTNNAREYASQGIESRLAIDFDTFGLNHELTTGIRYHQDGVDRDEPQYGYLMQQGELVFDGYGVRHLSLNRSESKAVALFVHDQIRFNDWVLTLGTRFEAIEDDYKNFQNKALDKSRSTQVIVPGIGLYYQWTDQIGVLAGVNKGFSPAGASADTNVNPEESINYEYGVRFNEDALSLEAIGFFSDYSNLIARCTASAGCINQSFNGGQVAVYGAEVLADYSYKLEEFTFPINLSYTYTESEFQTGFPQWGDVKKGDELPYLPKHQLRLLAGVEADDWRLTAALNYRGEMREVAGQAGQVGDSIFEKPIAALVTIDLAGMYQVMPNLAVKLGIDNLLDTQQIVSSRPTGARPNKPLSAVGTLSYQF